MLAAHASTQPPRTPADERWGDAPVHSLATALLLDKDEVHFFDEIGYYHPPFMHIPLKKSARAHCRKLDVERKARESDHPQCLKRWIEHNYLWRTKPLPFSTYLDDKTFAHDRSRRHNAFRLGASAGGAHELPLE